jgi:transcriptional regulator GlxA family with amidase domain
MTLARDYLRTGELTLDQIASRTGYASPNASPRPSAATTDSPGAGGGKAN